MSACGRSQISPRATRLIRRFLSALFVVASLLIMSAPGASAHSASNTPASNYVSRVLSVAPANEQFRARIIEAGNRLEVRWLSGPELRIPDYDGFPYLRVGPEGVFENLQSAATYINADRRSATPIPDIKPEGPPEWRKLSGSSVARFHYHPIHYMGSVPPVQVERAKNREHKIQDWTLDVAQGDRSFVVRGDLRWIPGPNPIVVLAIAVFVGLGVAVAAIVLGKRHGLHRALPLFMVALVALVVVDVIHLGGIAFGVEGGSGMARMLKIGWISVGAWVLALGAVVALARRRIDALYVGVFAAGVITLVGGLSDVGVLSASSVPFAFSTVVARFAIAFTVGLGAGVVIAGVALTGSLTALPGDDGSDADESEQTEPPLSHPAP